MGNDQFGGDMGGGFMGHEADMDPRMAKAIRSKDLAAAKRLINAGAVHPHKIPRGTEWGTDTPMGYLYSAIGTYSRGKWCAPFARFFHSKGADYPLQLAIVFDDLPRVRELLRDVSTEEEDDDDDDELLIAPKDRVLIRGLKSKPQHNGSYGFVVASQRDRWQVRLDSGEEMALKPICLQWISPLEALMSTPGYRCDPDVLLYLPVASVEMARYLLARPECSHVEYRLPTAARLGDLDRVMTLVAAGANVNAVELIGMLSTSSIGSRYSVPDGRYAMDDAMDEEKREALDAKWRKEMHRIDKSFIRLKRRLVLHEALDHPDVVKYLVTEAGLDLEATFRPDKPFNFRGGDEEDAPEVGETVLDRALRQAYTLESIQLLLEVGAVPLWTRDAAAVAKRRKLPPGRVLAKCVESSTDGIPLLNALLTLDDEAGRKFFASALLSVEGNNRTPVQAAILAASLAHQYNRSAEEKDDAFEVLEAVMGCTLAAAAAETEKVKLPLGRDDVVAAVGSRSSKLLRFVLKHFDGDVGVLKDVAESVLDLVQRAAHGMAGEDVAASARELKELLLAAVEDVDAAEGTDEKNEQPHQAEEDDAECKRKKRKTKK